MTPQRTHFEIGLTSGYIAQDTVHSSKFLLNSSLKPPRKKTNFNNVEREMLTCSGVLDKGSALS